MQKAIDDDGTHALVRFGFLYDLFPAQWILIVSSLLLIVIALGLARPSVVRKAHPELGENKGVIVTE